MKELRVTSTDSTDGRLVGSLRSVSGAGVVRLEASFDTHVDDLWSAVTDRDRLVQWLGEVEGDLRSGGEFRARFFAAWTFANLQSSWSF
jgi:hypothetical protein